MGRDHENVSKNRRTSPERTQKIESCVELVIGASSSAKYLSPAAEYLILNSQLELEAVIFVL